MMGMHTARAMALATAAAMLPATGCASAHPRAAAPPVTRAASAPAVTPVITRATPPAPAEVGDIAVARRDAAVAAESDAIAAISRMLVANGAPRARAERVAPAIVHHAREQRLDPLLVVAIIGVENAELDLDAKSPRGSSVGVMQVWKGWKEDIHDCGSDLTDPEVNVCFGTRVLRMALDETHTLPAALRRYNGCTRGARCERYVRAVYARAGRAVLEGGSGGERVAADAAAPER